MRKPGRESLGILAVALVVAGLAVVDAQQSEFKEFKKGQVELKQGNTAYTAPLLKVQEGSTLRPMGPGRWMLGLGYGTPRNTEPHVAVRMALTRLAGPGKYGNKEIGNLVVELDTDVWNFNSSQQTCTLTLTRLEASGAEGTVVCTGSGVPFSQMKFTAMP